MISIIIPVYNAEKYIHEAIESVVNQTYSNWELIIVNDGSKDSTEEICKKWLTKENRIKYILQENAGVSIARNNGINYAKGNYIALLDADDIWLPHNLEKKISLLKNKSCDWVYSNYFEFNENNTLVEKLHKKPHHLLKSLLLWEGQVVTAPSGIIFKKECFIEGSIFDKNLSTAADQDFCIQLASKFNGSFINESTWKYRVLNNSMSRNIDVMEKDHIYVYKKAKKNNLFYSYCFKQKCFAQLYLILAGSWWVNGKNKRRGLYFICKSFFSYPFLVLNKAMFR